MNPANLGARQPPIAPELRPDAISAFLAEDQLEAHLMQLDDVPLLLVYTHLTGDESLFQAYAPHIKGAWAFEVESVRALKARLVKALIATFEDYAASNRPLPPPPPPDLLQRMCNAAAGTSVPPEYMPMVMEDLNFDGTDAKTVRWRRPPSPAYLAQFMAVVIGAGYSGLAMCAKLKEAGIPFVCIEKNAEVGGTWFENTYPGVAVDTPNHFYSYSFRPKTDWDHYFARGPAIIDYIRTCYAEMAIAEHMHFNQEVLSAVWHADESRWHLTVRRADGSEYAVMANAVISGTGLLNRPSIPDFPGLDRFKGPKFHSARWDHTVSLEGKRVVQIGTGASGMQLGPQIAPIVAKLTIFQRSPHWARQNPLLFAEVSDAKKWGLEHVPYYTKWYRFLLLWATSDGMLPSLRKDPAWHDPEHSLNAANAEVRELLIGQITQQLGGDEELLAKVIPSFPPYGKRMLRDSNWYATLLRDNVKLIAGNVEEITEAGVVDEHGTHHPADVIVLATGFMAQMPLYPIDVIGTQGSLREAWAGNNPRAHLGITVPHFPNLFVLYGPNTNGGHGGSAVFNSECQVRYTMQALRELIEREARSLDVREEPFEAYNARVDAEHAQLVWTHPGVNNWYRNQAGRVVTNSPWRLSEYRNLTAEFNPAEYEIG